MGARAGTQSAWRSFPSCCLGPLAFAAALVFLGAADARASTVTVGSPLTGTFFSTATCGNAGGCTRANTALGDVGANVTSPVSGAVVRWRIAGNYGGTFKLRVLHPASSGQFTGAGTSAPMTATGTTTLTIPTSLPIQAGDLIGVDYGSGHHLSDASVPGSAFSEWAPALPDGSTLGPGPPSSGLELLFNADVQPPPGIIAVSPASGSISGGTITTIYGHDFTGGSVEFGSLPAASFNVDSDNQITAVSPKSSEPGPVDVRVATAAGTTPVLSTDRFSYTACVVPKLKGNKLEADKKKLRKADCKLGKVKGPTDKGAKVIGQQPKPGAIRPPGSKVKVTTK
jgi:hypothetical protein